MDKILEGEKKRKPREWLNGFLKSSLAYPQDSHLDVQTQRPKANGWKNTSHTLGNQEKAGVAMLVWDKVEHKTKTVRRKEIRSSHSDKGISIIRG